MATGIPNTEILFDLDALAGLENRLPPNVARNIPTGPGGILKNIFKMANASQQQEPVLGPDDFGSYVIPASDPTYSTGFDYARSIAGGIPMSQVIAPGVSYSPEQPMGYTQAQLNTPVGTTPPPPTQEPDDPSFLGTGIGGVRIPVDRDMKMPPLRDIFGGRRDTSSLENLMNIGKLFGAGIDQTGYVFDPITRKMIPNPLGGPDMSGKDISSLIPNVPTGRDFSIDREELIRDIREGIEIPKYEMPDLSQFARLEDIPTVPTLDREALIRDITGRIDIPKPPSIDRQALIEDIRSGIELPTYQAPDLSGFARLEDIPKIPSREDFLSIAREGIEIPQYQAPDLSGFARLEDIPTFDPNILKQDILMSIPQQQVPDVSQFVTQEDIQKAIAGIDIPTYQAPDLSAYDLRLAELEQQLAGLQQPTGGRFSISQPAPRGLI